MQDNECPTHWAFTPAHSSDPIVLIEVVKVNNRKQGKIYLSLTNFVVANETKSNKYDSVKLKKNVLSKGNNKM